MIYDAIIVGGSFAGLSAAMQLVRARRQVLIIDAGQPRNRFADHSHGVLGHDGKSGFELLGSARTQLACYPTVSILSATVSEVLPQAGRFTVTLDTSESVEGRRVLLATGVSDPVPDTPGLRERWGKTVLPCPYCHGYEIGGGSIGVLASSPLAVHQAGLIADWGDVTLFTDGKIELDDGMRLRLARRKVKIETRSVVGLEGAAPAIDAVLLADGRKVAVRALFLGMQTRQTSTLATQLGCAIDENPGGFVIRTDALKQTTVPGLYAAGDAAIPMANITFASADGVRAGVGMHHSLIEEETAAG